MRILALLTLLTLAPLALGACQTTTESQAMAEDAMMEDESMGTQNMEDSTMTDDSMAMENGYTGELLAGDESKYLAFTEEDYAKAQEEGKTILLYFYASWCPTCQAEQPKTEAAFDELNDDSIIGFRVNYKDSSTEQAEEDLAREFGIAYQHTKVILKDGQQVLKAPDSWDKDRYLSELRGIEG